MFIIFLIIMKHIVFLLVCSRVIKSRPAVIAHYKNWHSLPWKCRWMDYYKHYIFVLLQERAHNQFWGQWYFLFECKMRNPVHIQVTPRYTQYTQQQAQLLLHRGINTKPCIPLVRLSCHEQKSITDVHWQDISCKINTLTMTLRNIKLEDRRRR